MLYGSCFERKTNAFRTGRADVILDGEEGQPGRLAIVDYTVTRSDDQDSRFDWQLQVYTHAGRREGLDVRASYLHSLVQGRRGRVDVSEEALKPAVERVEEALRGIRRREFPPRSSAQRCEGCDYAVVCRHRPRLVRFD